MGEDLFRKRVIKRESKRLKITVVFDTKKKEKKGKAKETRFSYPNYPRHNFNPTCSPMTILPQLNVIGGLIKIGMEGGGRGWLGSRHQREKGILEGETTNANASGELQNISREHSATIALHETSPPLEPVDATSADVFSVLSASSSNPRASIVRPIPPPFLHRNFLPFVANRVFSTAGQTCNFSFLSFFSFHSSHSPKTKHAFGGGICRFRPLRNFAHFSCVRGNSFDV